jgi:hypothetical protein
MIERVLFSYARMVLCLCLLLFAIFGGGVSLFAQEKGEERELQAELPEPVLARPLAPYSVTPVVLNEKAKPRDILKKELLLTNNTEQRVGLYIAVRNIDPLTGEQVFEGPTVADTSISLANWIEITRGVIDLEPGETRKIPYLIHVNLNAKPGSYFARIAFHRGRNRIEAETKSTDVAMVLNLEVLDDAKERVQLAGFMSDASVVLGKEVEFTYAVSNVGNRDIEPRGVIRIFNRNGEEVGSVPVNVNGEAVTPEEKAQLASVWATEGRFGKYKAFLDLEYGESQVASVQDTVYFWVFPWKEVFTALMGMFVLAVVGTYIVHFRSIARVRPQETRVHEDVVPSDSSFESYLEGSNPRKGVEGRRTEIVSVPRGVVNMQERTVASRDVVNLSSRTQRGGTIVRNATVQLSSRRNGQGGR